MMIKRATCGTPLSCLVITCPCVFFCTTQTWGQHVAQRAAKAVKLWNPMVLSSFEMDIHSRCKMTMAHNPWDSHRLS
jgi:hypothetical protein